MKRQDISAKLAPHGYPQAPPPRHEPACQPQPEGISTTLEELERALVYQGECISILRQRLGLFLCKADAENACATPMTNNCSEVRTTIQHLMSIAGIHNLQIQELTRLFDA